jgi:hypothetical protein
LFTWWRPPHSERRSRGDPKREGRWSLRCALRPARCLHHRGRRRARRDVCSLGYGQRLRRETWRVHCSRAQATGRVEDGYSGGSTWRTMSHGGTAGDPSANPVLRRRPWRGMYTMRRCDWKRRGRGYDAAVRVHVRVGRDEGSETVRGQGREAVRSS